MAWSVKHMATFNLTAQSAAFKDTYAKLSENVYNSASVLLARVKKSYDFTGKKKYMSQPLGFAGGVGSGILPTANGPLIEDPVITAKKVYSRCEIEREAIKAADDKGAFIKQTQFSVQKAVEAYMFNMERILCNSLDNGQLGVGDNSTNVTGAGTAVSPYVVRMSATGWKEANWEEQQGVNVGSETTVLFISAVNPSTRDISFVGTSATLAAAAGGPSATNAKFYMQGSKDNDPQSIVKVLDATTGSLYGVTVGRRWQSYQAASSGAGITTDVMNKDMLEIQKRCGKVPNLIMTSFTQYRKILNLLEDHKRYPLEPRAQNLKGKVSFEALEFMSAAGPVPIVPNRMFDEDRVAYINDNFIEICHRPDFGWFDDDGTVFLRKADDDDYEARYGGYLEVYAIPTFHGTRTGLAT